VLNAFWNTSSLVYSLPKNIGIFSIILLFKFSLISIIIYYIYYIYYIYQSLSTINISFF
jgi:hypothetical protein